MRWTPSHALFNAGSEPGRARLGAKPAIQECAVLGAIERLEVINVEGRFCAAAVTVRMTTIPMRPSQGKPHAFKADDPDDQEGRQNLFGGIKPVFM